MPASEALDRIIALVDKLRNERMVGVATTLGTGLIKKLETERNVELYVRGALTSKLAKGLAAFAAGIIKVTVDESERTKQFDLDVVVLTRDEFEQLGNDLARVRAALAASRTPESSNG